MRASLAIPEKGKGWKLVTKKADVRHHRDSGEVVVTVTSNFDGIEVGSSIKVVPEKSAKAIIGRVVDWQIVKKRHYLRITLM